MAENNFKKSQTRENLMKAFAGESMARMRYNMYASVAEKERLIIISNIFNDTASNEKEHAEVYFKFLDSDDVRINDISYPSCYGNTLENLLCAAKYEEEEHSIMYPEYGKVAETEGFKEIADAFYNIASIEEHHSKRYLRLAEMVKNNTMYRSEEKIEWKCTHCGFVCTNEEPPQKCPVCGKQQGYFVRNYKCE